MVSNSGNNLSYELLLKQMSFLKNNIIIYLLDLSNKMISIKRKPDPQIYFHLFIV